MYIDKVKNTTKFLSLALMGVVLSLSSCASPFDALGYGQVVVDFGGQSRGPEAPASISSVELSVTAAGMQTIYVTLSGTTLNTTLDIPAGKARSIEVLAKDSSGQLRFKGIKTLDVKAGETLGLEIQMVAVYALLYDANGADSGTVPTPLYKMAGDSATMAANSGGLSKLGYSFSGWNTASNGTGTDYVVGQAIVMPAADITLYAKWGINQYSIIYFDNGKSSGDVPPMMNSDFGTAVVIADNLAGLVGPLIQDGIHRRFTGWNTDSGGLGTTYLPGDSLILGPANVVLFAQYQSAGTIVGQIGPAGGLIFYENPTYGADGWRYLESALTDQAASGVQVWSNVSTTLIPENFADIGKGLENSAAIIAQLGHATSAALLCDNYSFGGFDDWFLPSELELGLMYINLKGAALGGFSLNYYWSSTESLTPSYARRQHFNTGVVTETAKTANTMWIRAIRRFLN